MPHDQSQLRAKLTELNRELASLQNIDPQVREHLQQTLEEIEAGWDELHSGAASLAPHEGGVVHRLTETMRHFEGEHPTFAGLLGSVIDTLGRMGI